MSELGTKENPFEVAPDDWNESGVPYSAYCRCSKCGLIAQSTFTFDYYADNPGDSLVCGRCKGIDLGGINEWTTDEDGDHLEVVF